MIHFRKSLLKTEEYFETGKTAILCLRFLPISQPVFDRLNNRSRCIFEVNVTSFLACEMKFSFVDDHDLKLKANMKLTVRVPTVIIKHLKYTAKYVTFPSEKRIKQEESK